MSSKKSYQKQIARKWIDRIGFEQYQLWLLPSLQRFAQGRGVGMKNGAEVREGDIPTSEHDKEGRKQLARFREAMIDHDWLFLRYEERVPI